MEYDKLNDKTKNWILSKNGQEIYGAISAKLVKRNLDPETAKQAFAFWLNQRDLRSNRPYFRIQTTKPDNNGKTNHILENKIEPRLAWEKYDEDISVQGVKNEFQVAWSKDRQKQLFK